MCAMDMCTALGICKGMTEHYLYYWFGSLSGLIRSTTVWGFIMILNPWKWMNKVQHLSFSKKDKSCTLETDFPAILLLFFSSNSDECYYLWNMDETVQKNINTFYSENTIPLFSYFNRDHGYVTIIDYVSSFSS